MHHYAKDIGVICSDRIAYRSLNREHAIRLIKSQDLLEHNILLRSFLLYIIYMRSLRLTLSFLCVCFHSMLDVAQCAATFKTGNPINTNITTGQATLFTSSLAMNASSYFTVTPSTAMITDILQVGLGVISSTFIIERQQGWAISVIIANSTQFTIEAVNRYDLSTPSSTISLMRIRYIVSCHPYIDISLIQFNFASGQNVSDPTTYDESCRFIRCRKVSSTAYYSAAKASALSITGTSTLAGYTIFDLPLDSEVSIPTSTNYNTTWAFDNYTTTDYYGVRIELSNFGNAGCQATTVVYGFLKLSRVSFYLFTWETKLTNTYWTRVVSGSASIGCYYDAGGCIYPLKIKVGSNTTIKTGQTFLNSFYDNMYFFGLNHFIIYHDLNDADFTSSPYSDPAIKMNFATTTSSGNDPYSTNIAFTGNPDNLFSFKFGYLIDTNFDCPSSGNIYHISSTQCDSVCPSAQFPNLTNMVCYKCHSQCSKCTGPNTNECQACYTTQNRVLNGTTCMCQIYYFYDNGVDICAACHYSCLSCSAGTNSSCTACNATDYRYNDTAFSCPCNPGYYDGGGKTCVKCHFSCLTCSNGANNNCITCPSMTTTFRNISSNTCVCIAGYWDAGTTICSQCHYSCKTCSTGSTSSACDTCEATAKRTYTNTTAKTCPCNGGYYDAGVAVCQICHSTCKTCNGPANTDCTGCKGSAIDFRNPNTPTGECQCMTGYYDFADVCHKCYYTCLNCTGNAVNNCLACNQVTNFRAFNASTNQCDCMDGYYDIALPQTPICASCDVTCATCVTSSTFCLSCRSTDNRVLLANACPCVFGYVQVTGSCVPCHYSCQSCSGPLGSNCLTCDTTIRFVSGTSCPCKPGTYDDGNNKLCKACHIHCAECVAATNSSCTACNAAMMRTIPATTPNFCYCNAHYFNAGPAACSPCSSQCNTCQFNSTYCLTCYSAQFRTLNTSHLCQCQPHYYDTGADVCLTCATQCYECVGISTNCTSCPVLRTLSSYKCLCINNYYEDSATSACLQCNILCELCQNSSTQCTKCYSNMNRQLSNAQCVCSFGFYYDGANPICKACPYYCLNCTSATTCLQCDITSHRSIVSGICTCQPSYYDNGISLVCLTCSPICQECSDYSVCTVCNASLHRQLSLGQCKCFGKFYDAYTIANQLTLCQPCHYTCATCLAGTLTSCIVCEPNRSFDPTNYSCPCSDGYYQASLICYLCDPICRTCVGLPTNCTSCFSGLPLLNNTCLCFSGQYSSASVCYSCDPKCKECDGVATYCTECYASQLTTLTNHDCICSSGTFKDPTNLTCIPCHTTCVQCTGPNSNQCTLCNGTDPINRVINANFECICNPNYFLNTTTNMCSICHASCISCVGPSDYNCTACASTSYTLIGSYCQPNLSCLNYLYDGHCVNICPKTSYPTLLHTCEKCTNGCLYCLSPTVCLQCLNGYFFNSTTSTCSPICQIGKYVDANGGCVPCMANCIQCQWSSPKNQAVCLRCAPSFYLKDQIECTSVCPSPYYLPLGSLCMKCIGNCLTCNTLSANGCILCKDNTSFMGGQCFPMCPLGYYKDFLSGAVQPTCQLCPANCQSCGEEGCLSCIGGFYLSNRHCVEQGYFYDTQSSSSKLCHPNCISCSNTSFASCINCRPHRGDPSELAISGYCECKEGSIDMGNGVCDFEKYSQLQQVTGSLASYSSATLYLMGLVSITSSNYIGLIGMVAYLQSYSTFYYVNSSMVMSIDYVLKQYRKSNINSYFQSESQAEASKVKRTSKRMLVEIQTDKSLFLRDQPYLYLIEWAMFPAIVVGLVWACTFAMSCAIICCRNRSNQVRNIFDEASSQQETKVELYQAKNPKNQFYEQNTYNQIQFNNHRPKLGSQLPYNLENKKTIRQPKSRNSNEQYQQVVIKYIQKFYSVFHEAVAIGIQLVFGAQIIFYAIVSFKILRVQQSTINVGKLVLSVLLFCYIVLYTVRLFIGAWRYYSNQKLAASQGINAPKNQSPIRLLFHMHSHQKRRPMNALYIPFILLRNELISVLIVAFSDSPYAQLISCGVLLILFTVYSLLFCPYRLALRVCLHVSQIILICQLAIFFMVISTQYGSVYSLDILQQGNLYKFAWVLLALNYAQIAIFMSLAIYLIFYLSIQRFCKKNPNAIQNSNNQEPMSVDQIEKEGGRLKKVQQQSGMNESHEVLRYEQQNEEFNQGDQNQQNQHKRKPASLNSMQASMKKTEPNEQQRKDHQAETVVLKRYRVKQKYRRSRQQPDPMRQISTLQGNSLDQYQTEPSPQTQQNADHVYSPRSQQEHRQHHGEELASHDQGHHPQEPYRYPQTFR